MGTSLTTSFASVHPHYGTKVERTGRAKDHMAKRRAVEKVLRA